jgi:hypothetical protein
MKAKLTAVVIAAAVALGYSGIGLSALSKEERKAEEDRIATEHKSAKDQCRSLKANARDVCTAEADGASKVARAELEARDKGTIKSQTDARIARAEADYEIAREQCDDLAGNLKEVCLMDAKAALARGKADANVAHASKEAGRDVSFVGQPARLDHDKVSGGSDTAHRLLPQ